MTPWRRFTRGATGIHERRRRRRISDVTSRVLLGFGFLATFFQRKEVIAMFPESWQVFVAGAAAAFGVIAGAELLESHIDGRRYAAKQERESRESLARASELTRIYPPPPRDD